MVPLSPYRGEQIFVRNAAHLKLVPHTVSGDDDSVTAEHSNVPPVYTRPTSARTRRAPDRYTDNWIHSVGTLV